MTRVAARARPLRGYLTERLESAERRPVRSGRSAALGRLVPYCR